MGFLRRSADRAALSRSAELLEGRPASVTIPVRGVLFNRHDKDVRMRKVQAFMEARGYRCVSTSMRLNVTEMTFENLDP